MKNEYDYLLQHQINGQGKTFGLFSFDSVTLGRMFSSIMDSELK